ncbi:hypothetical protein PNK_0148 [Candidatus Protochlamydia naegleriophila]|uniref:Uncharacterized protein n=1 Tax=Candidatus Protochlamydia naegleriophila TaxID=389348 RepID=A0A0U5JAB0_9BACT|nr:hypothetical protein [Candidatus Protochlamydia naegleriophila]CUI15786.1 hypothetical protein PNK_0148 [Candidatus Protochlamydia naegleriophila]
MINPSVNHLPSVEPSAWSNLLSAAKNNEGAIAVRGGEYVIVDASMAKERLNIKDIIHISKQAMEMQGAKKSFLSSKTSSDLTEQIGHLTKELIAAEKDKNPYSFKRAVNRVILIAASVSIIGIPVLVIPWLIKSREFNKQIENNNRVMDRQLDLLKCAKDFNKTVLHFDLIKKKIDRVNVSMDFKSSLLSLSQASGNQALNKVVRVEDQLASFEKEFVLSKEHKQLLEKLLNDIKTSKVVAEDSRDAIEKIINVIQSEIDPVIKEALGREMEAINSTLQGLIDHPEALQNIELGTLVDGLRSIYREFASLYGKPTDISYTLGRLLQEPSMLEWLTQNDKELASAGQRVLMQPAGAERDAELLSLLEKGDHLLKGGQFMQEILGTRLLATSLKDTEKTLGGLIQNLSSREVIKQAIQKGAKFNPDEGFRRAGGMMEKYLKASGN